MSAFLPYSSKPSNKRRGYEAVNTQMELFSAEPLLGFPSHLSEQELHHRLARHVTLFQNYQLGSMAATVLFLKTRICDCTSSFSPDHSLV